MWSSIFLSAFRKKNPIQNKQPKKVKLLVEALETRELLSTIAQWSFPTTPATVAAPYNSPPATTDNTGGTALLTTIGMGTGSNGYTGHTADVASDDILGTPGTASVALSSLTETGTTVTATTTAANSFVAGEQVTIGGTTVSPAGYKGVFTINSIINSTQFTYTAASGLATPATLSSATAILTEQTLRVRGAPNNGWATHAAGAPNDSQGLELDVSTVGYANIQFAFDWYSTTQGIRDLQFQYNTNIGNAAGWTSFGGTSPTGTYVTPGNDWYNAPGSPTIAVNLSAIPGANNDANFGVRLVAAFDSTGHVPNDFASAGLSSGQTVIYNNNSGNWRFDNLTFTGSQGSSAPQIDSANSTSVYEGQAGTYQVTTTGSPAPTFSLTGAPSWVTINSTGLLSFATGRPTISSSTPYTFTINAANGVAPNAQQTFTVTDSVVAPVFSSVSSTSVYAGQSGTFQVTTNAGPATSAYSLAGAPAWASINNSGVLTFTNAAPVTTTTPLTFQIKATNSVGTTAQNFTFTEFPTIAYATQNASYNQTFSTLPTTDVTPVSGTGTPVVGPYDLTAASPNGFGAAGLTGWYAGNLDGGAEKFGVGEGSATTGALMAFHNSASSTNMALGTVSTTSTATRFGAIFVNNSGLTLNSFTLSYIGEEWREGTAAGPQNLNFSYAIGGTNILTSTFSNVSALGFTSPHDGDANAGTALDGTNPANQVAVSGTLNGFSWGAGQALEIVWDKGTGAGSSDGLGIQNLTFSAQRVNQFPPTITTNGRANVFNGQTSTYQVGSTGFPAPMFTLNGNPAWVSISNSGLLTFTTPPTVSAATQYTFTINASNGVNPAASQTFTVVNTGAAPVPFTAGNLVLLEVNNDGNTAPYASEGPVTLVEYQTNNTPAGTTAVQTVPVLNNETPNNTTGNQPLTLDTGTVTNGNGNGVGILSRSGDSSALTFGGNDDNVNGTIYSSTNRVIGQVGVNPASGINTTTFGQFDGGDDFRGVVEANPSTIYTFGHTANGGLRYFNGVGNSPTIGTEVDTTATKNNVRDATVAFNGQVFYSSAKSTVPGIFVSFNAADTTPVFQPTSPGTDQEVIQDPNPSGNPNGMFVADMNGDGILDNGDRLYFVDATAGLYVSTYNGTTWSTPTLVFNPTTPGGSTENLVDLAGQVNVAAGDVQLYYTDSDGKGNSALYYTDTLSNTNTTLISNVGTSDNGLSIPGVAFAPVNATTISESITPNPTNPTVNITFKATLSSPNAVGGVYPGLVYFVDANSNTVLNPAGTAINTSGVATFQTSSLNAGQYNVHAYYAGTAAIAAATSTPTPLSITGTKASSTTLASTPNSSTAGGTVVIKATVSGASGNPTGTVNFFDNGGLLGTGTLSTTGGVTTATLSTAGLNTGSHTLTAFYAGDNTYLTSNNSNTDTQVVNAGATITVNDGSANGYGTVAAGATVTFTATVTGNAVSGLPNGSPTGTVQFFEDGSTTPFATGTLTGSGNNLTATASTMIGQAGNQLNNINGSHLITATYVPSVNSQYVGVSTSPPWIETAKQNFGIGDLIVLDRPNQPSNASQIVSVLEYTTTGQLVQTVTLPDINAGATHTFGLSGHAATEGALGLSANQSLLSLFGFDLPVGAVSATSTSAATNPRTVVSINNAGAIDSSTTVEVPTNDALLNPRGAVSLDGNQFVIVGSGSTTNTGIQYAVDGKLDNPPTAVGANNVEGYGAEILGGQLYISTGGTGGSNGVDPVIENFGTALPTGLTTGTPLSGLGAAYAGAGFTSPTPYGFLLFNHLTGTSVNPDTLYVADQTYGLLKFYFDGTNWQFLSEKLNNNTSVEGLVGFETLSDPANGGNPSFTLYATAALNNGNPSNQLLSFTDDAPYNQPNSGGLFNVIANAVNPTDTFSGLAFAPLNTTTTTVTSSINPALIGQSVTFTAAVADTTGSFALTGTVTFTLDGVAQTPVTVSTTAGVTTATFTVPNFAAGAHTVLASYSGDVDNGTSSNTLTETVSKYIPFAPGNLIVLQSGDGTTYNAQGPLFLDDYTPSGTLVESVPIPNNEVTGGTGNQPITIDLSAAAGNGLLSRSYDGSVLTFDGVDSGVNNGTFVAPATPTGAANRVVAVVNNNPSAANFLNTTTYGPFYVGDDNRASVAESATGPIWTAGHPNQAGGAVSQGVLYFPTEGPSSGTQVSAGANIRGITIGFNNVLYFSTAGSSSTGLAGIYQESQALPTQATPPADTMVVPALFSASKLGGIYLADMNGDGIVDNGDRLYFVDDGTVGGAGTGGVYASTYNSANPGNHWSEPVRLGDGIITSQNTPQLTAQLRGLTGAVSQEGTGNNPGQVLLTATEFDNVAGNNSYLLNFYDQGTGVSIASASEVGTTVTVNSVTPTNFVTGETIQVDGVGAGTGAAALTGGYNGAWTVTVISPTQFTYADTNAGASNLATVSNQGGADITVAPSALVTMAGGSITIAGKNFAAEAIRGVAYAPVAPTTVTLSASVTTASPGTPVAFTATLVNSQITPTGTVTFIDQNTNTVLGQGTIATTGGVTTAVFTTSTLVGNHYVSAYFAGGGTGQLASATSNTVQVNESGSTASHTAVSATISAVAVGVPVTLTATVTGGSGTPAGTVSFYQAGTALSNLLGTSLLSGGGTASFTTSFATAALQNITAIYNGNNTYATSNGVTTVTSAVNATATFTTSANNVALNATPTYTATINGNSTLGAPAGTVQFSITNTFTGVTTAIGTAVTLTPGTNKGTATVTSPALANPGSYLITLTFTPTGSNNPYAAFAVNTTTATNGVALIETVQQAFKPGDLVAVQRGDGTTNLGSSGYLVFLAEYTPLGVLVQKIALPNTSSGSSNALLLSGQNGAEGLLNRSANGYNLTLAGYDLPVGQQFVTSTFPFQFPRTIAEVNAAASVNTSTTIATTSSSSVPYNPLDVVSNDGNEFWLVSNLPVGDTTDSGIEYVSSVGATTATQLGTADTSGTSIAIAGGQLYAATSDLTGGSSMGAYQVGTGLPTTAATATLTALPGLQAAYQANFPNAQNPQQLLFFNHTDGTTNNPDTLYVADLSNGLLKFALVGGVWTFQGEKLVFSGGASGVAGYVINPGPSADFQLYVTGSNIPGANPNQIDAFTDTNAYNQPFLGGVFGTLAFVGASGTPPSPNGNMNFAGLSFVPAATTTTAITRTVAGANVTLTATVASTFDSPSGTVTFMKGTTVLGTGTLTTVGSQQQAVFITTAAALGGSYTISAVYNPGGLSLATDGTSTGSATFYNAGDLVVSLVGTGTTLTSSGTATSLLDYTTTGTPVPAATVALPTTSTNAFTEGGTTTTEGYLTDSADGHSISLAGYLANAGSSTSSAVREIGVLSAGGSFNSTTQMPSSTGSTRVAISADGLGFWVATSTGIRYVPFGNLATVASTQVTAEVASPTAVGISVAGTTSGQLYGSAGAGALASGVPALDSPYTVGTGLPTDAGQGIAVSPSFPTARDAFNNFPTTNQFAISPDGQTIYMADGRTDSTGGILKYENSGGTWTLTESLQLDSFSISSASETGTTVTITTNSNHDFVVGQSVTIAGVSVTGYNTATATITSTPTPNTFTYTLAAQNLAAGSGGFANSNDGGLRALVADFSNPSSPVLYATTTAASANRIVQLTDLEEDAGPGTGFTATTVRTAPTNEAFRGIALAPTLPGTTASTTTLTVTNSPNSYGAGATLTATVTANATGWVSFRQAGVEIGAAPIVNGTATLITAGNLNAGTYSVTAVYTGDATFAASTSTAQSVTISKATASVLLTFSANPVATGVSDTLTATITAPAGTAPTGTVTFKNGSTTIGSPATIAQTIVNRSGNPTVVFTATLTTSFAAIGNQSISANYGGDTNFATSADTESLLVVSTTTTAVTTSNPNPSATTPTPVTLTATVTSAGGTPTGSVQFYDDLLPIGSAVTLNGSALATVTVTTGLLEAAGSLAPGLNSISAVYTPDTAGLDTFFTSTGVYEQAVQAKAFSASDQFILRVGDGTTSLNAQSPNPIAGAGSIGSTISIDEYRPAGTLVQSIILPTADGTGTQNTIRAVVGNGQQSSTEQLSLSGDGQYLFVTGYDNNPLPFGTALAVPTASGNAAVPRAIARIKFDGTVQTEAFSGVETSGNFNGVYSPDGNRFYVSGSNGVSYFSSFTPSASPVSATATIASSIGATATGLEAYNGNLAVVSVPYTGAFLVGAFAGFPTANVNAVAISSLTESAAGAGTTVTVTTSAANGFVTGATVTIAGAVPAGYNGTFTVTVTSSTTFTYTAASSGLGNSTTGGTATEVLALPGLPSTDAVQQFPIDVYFTHLGGAGAPSGINTMYISDDGPSFANGAITKWALSSAGTWSLVDTLTAGSGNSAITFYWLSGVTDASGNITLYSTYGNGGNADTGAGFLYAMTDTNGWNAPIGTGGSHSNALTTVASVPTGSNEVYRGVAGAPSAETTTITNNGPNPSSLGASVSFTVAVSGGQVATGGTVTLEDAAHGNSPVGTGTLVNGTVTISTTTLAIGSDSIFASYAGDTFHQASQSATVPQTVTAGPFSKYAVTIFGGSSTVAGTSLLYTIQATDAAGNPVSSYSGPSTVTVTASPSDPLSGFPVTDTLNSSGFGFYIGTFKTVGSYTLTAASGGFTGTSSSITVTPANAIYFSVAAGATATTGIPLVGGVTVKAFDLYGNLATGYTGTVKLSSTDGAASLGGAYPFTTGTGGDNGIHTFPVTLNTAGSQTVSATDTTAANPNVMGTSGAITVRGLLVSAFTPTPTGFTVTFNKPIVPTDLTLYGATANAINDVAVSGVGIGTIHGTLFIDPTNQILTFKATANYLTLLNGLHGNNDSVVLPDATYNVTLLSGSGSNGFLDLLGGGLDGTNSGGHANFTTSFATHFQGNATPVLGIPDFARGPDSNTPIVVPNNNAFGIPLTLYNAPNVTDVTFTLTYNASLLNILSTLSGANSDATDPAAILFLVSNTGGVATFHYTDTNPQSATSATPLVLGDLKAVVPSGSGAAALGLYQVKEQLQLGSIVINHGSVAGAVGANGVHVNAYFGDVNGDKVIDGLDKLAGDTVAQGRGTGFSAFTQLDPAIIGDVAGDSSVDAGDVSTIDAYVAQLAPTQIPVPPTQLPSGNANFVSASSIHSPNAADPTLSLAQTGGLTSNGSPTDLDVAVLLDHPHPEGSTGLTEASLSLTYDATVLNVTPADITLGSLPSQGSGWQLTAVVDQTTGQIGIQLYSTTPITAAAAGSLVNIAFHVLPGQSPGERQSVNPATAVAVQLVESATPNGQRFDTMLADAQGGLILSQGADQVRVPTRLDASESVTLGVTGDVWPGLRYSEAPDRVAATGASEYLSPGPTEADEMNEATPLAVLSNGSLTGDAAPAHTLPASLIVTGMLAFQPNMAALAVPQLAGQVIQVANAPLGNLVANNLVPQQVTDRWFLAMARATDAPADFNGLTLDQYVLQQELLSPTDESPAITTPTTADSATQAQPNAIDLAVMDKLFADMADGLGDF